MMRRSGCFALVVVFACAALVPAPTSLLAAPVMQNDRPVTIYFFRGEGCPHCAAAEPFLAGLAEQYPNVTIRDFEVWHNEANRAPLMAMAAKFGFEPAAVPIIFVGDRYWVGYADEPIGREIAQAVAACAASGCPDAAAGVPAAAGSRPAAASTRTADGSASVGGEACGEAAATPVFGVLADEAKDQPATAQSCEQPAATTGAALAAAPSAGSPAAASSGALVLPLIGTLDLQAQSLALSTALIAFVDGFNPCSLWVLSVLLALTLHTGSRKKVLLIGLVFLTVTSLVYVTFIAGLFTMFTIVSFVGWIQVIVALLALLFAIVNIKGYFWYKEGLSFTIADDKKQGLYRSMRRVLKAGDSIPALIGATVVMSAGASLVEFSCTAGFPVLWSNLVASQGVTALTFVALLALYMLIYQLDELGIFLAAVVSLRASKLEEKHGRVLKLLGGMLMLTLAVVMLAEPTLMNRLGSALVVFAIAFGATLLVLLLHRAVLPRLGIYIGSEFLAANQE